VSDQNARYARLRHTATGALAALAAVGAIVGTAALAATPHARPHRHATHRHATVANGSTTKTPTSPVPDKTQTPQPPANQQPFLTAIEQLVDNGTITATQGQAVDSQIQQGYIDPSTLTGFTPTQLQAVQQALASAKQALAPAGLAPAGPGQNGTPQKDARRVQTRRGR
jgi:hypothetical protein